MDPAWLEYFNIIYHGIYNNNQQLSKVTQVPVPAPVPQVSSVSQRLDLPSAKALWNSIAANINTNTNQRMGSSGGNWGPAQTYFSQKVKQALADTKVVNIRKVWVKLPHVLTKVRARDIKGCCVCKTITPSNIKWYKPFRVMYVHGLLKKDFPYQDMYSMPKHSESNMLYDKLDYQFVVCSEECENFIYLTLLDV